MTLKELQNTRIKRGDILVYVVQYSSLGPHTYGGPIISTNPIVVFPNTGNNGYFFPQLEKQNVEYHIVNNSFIVRTFVYIKSLLSIVTLDKK